MVDLRPDEPGPTARWRDETVRQKGIRPFNILMTLAFLVPVLLFSLWGGIVILQKVNAAWQVPWGVFFIGLALSPVLIALGRRGIRETEPHRGAS